MTCKVYSHCTYWFFMKILGVWIVKVSSFCGHSCFAKSVISIKEVFSWMNLICFCLELGNLPLLKIGHFRMQNKTFKTFVSFQGRSMKDIGQQRKLRYLKN